MALAPLSGGRWVTIEHEHVYVKGSAIVAGHIPTDEPGLEELIKKGDASKIFLPHDYVRRTSRDEHTRSAKTYQYKEKMEKYEANGKITQKERDSVEHYTGNGYEGINEYLRLGGASSKKASTTKTHVNNIQSAIAKSPVTEEDQILYRHFTHDPQHEVGSVIQHKGFLSAATLSQSSFMQKEAGQEKGFGYEIAVPKGSRGVLEGVNTSELETILNHGSKFKVLGKRDLQYDRGYGGLQTRTIYQLGYLG